MLGIRILAIGLIGKLLFSPVQGIRGNIRSIGSSTEAHQVAPPAGLQTQEALMVLGPVHPRRPFHPDPNGFSADKP